MRLVLAFIISSLAGFGAMAQKETVCCSNNPARSWWDVQAYDLSVNFDLPSGQILGKCMVSAKVMDNVLDSFQIDLDKSLQIDSVVMDLKKVLFTRYGNVYYIKGSFSSMVKNDNFEVSIYYSGKPQDAVNAPWDGGFVRSKDQNGNPWWAVACQGSGGSLWFPCKNFQGDEPEKVRTHFTVPEQLSVIGNGRLLAVAPATIAQMKTWTWEVTNPINNYDITFYIGDYVHWSDSFQGLKGNLSLDYYVLRDNLKKAEAYFGVVKPMLQCFEGKIGPYPFYEDGYKLVEAPYLGMEHQSAIAYGNGYEPGYRGKDRSKTGVGLLFDFIIIHESGHEWFGNSITAYDKADTWIHEGFTSYTETLFAECLLGREQAFTYQYGKKYLIRNDRPVQGAFSHCDEGGGDHYDKAGFVVHMIRSLMGNDSLFFDMLRGMNRKFYHKIVSGRAVEQFIQEWTGKDLSRFFNQYLRHKELPVLKMKSGKSGSIQFRWTNCVPGFDMPVLLQLGNKKAWIQPKEKWTSLTIDIPIGEVTVSPDFLIETELLR